MARHIDISRKIVVKPGDKFKWVIDIHCRDGSVMKEGSVLEVLEKTASMPYGEIGPNGYNLLCRAVNGTTVWSTLEHCIDRGLLEKVK